MLTANLSFAGCGFLGIYHVGVASCFRQYAYENIQVMKIAGASVGSIAAAALICDVSLGQTTTDILAVAVNARRRTLGPLNPRFDLNRILRERLEAALPQNAHVLCSGRLFISVTKLPGRKNALLSQFNTREELIQAILCSCFIPFYSALKLPVFQGENYVDGGMSDNLPILDEDTITVSPFAGEHDICPQDESYNLLQINLVNTNIAVTKRNFYRFLRILFPPEPEILSKMCQQGFDDALRYLQRRSIIRCMRCLGIEAVIRIQPEFKTDVEVEHDQDNCIECRTKRQVANSGKLPEAVVIAIQEACDEVNKGVINWLFRRRPIKLMAILSLPYTLPVDISIAIFSKVWQELPSLRKELIQNFKAVLDLIKVLLKKFDSKRKYYSAMFSCELAITEYDYKESEIDSPYPYPSPYTATPREPCLLQVENDAASVKRSSSDVDRRSQRKSYAGFGSYRPQRPEEQPTRRRSFSEIGRPDRIVRNMRIGFSVGILSNNDKKKDLFRSLKSLGEEGSSLNVMDLANRALQMEGERSLGGSRESILDVTDSEAVMSYSYVDEDDTVKVTELYNVTAEDDAMTPEQRLLNRELQWDSDWMRPPPELSRSLDDSEFAMSSDDESETSLRCNDKFVVDTDSRCTEETGPSGADRFTAAGRDMPKRGRKMSFIVVK